MNIKELYLQNFGKFENFRLNLESGFNLIYGKNEVGKSTIMDFIMLMFYGHKGRKRDIRENPRRRYQPWNGRQMQGQIIFKSKGQSYRLERNFGTTHSRDITKLFNELTGSEINLQGEPGEHIFGIGEEAFERSVFINVDNNIVDQTSSKDEITQRLMNMVTTGSEESSYQETKQRLEDTKVKFISKNKKRGSLVELREKIEELNSKMSEAKDDEKEKDAYKAELASYQQQSTAYKQQLKQKNAALEIANLESERQEYLEDLNHFKRNQKLAKELAELDSELETSTEKIDQAFVNACSDNLAKIKSLKAEAQTLTEEIKKLKQQHENLAKETREEKVLPEGLIDDLRSKTDQKQKLVDQVKQLEQRFSHLEKQQESIKKIKQRHEDLARNREKLQTQTDNLEKLIETENLIKNKLAKNKQQAQTINQDLEFETNELRQAESQKTQLINELKFKKQNLNSKLEMTQENIKYREDILKQKGDPGSSKFIMVGAFVLALVLFTIGFLLADVSIGLRIGLFVFAGLSLIFGIFSLSKNKKQAANQQSEIEKLEELKNDFTKRRDQGSAELTKLNNQIEILKDLIKQRQDNVSKLKANYLEIEKNIRSEQPESLQAEARRENQAKEIEILKNTIELEEKNIEDAKQQLDISLSDPEKDETKKIEAEIKDLQSEIDQITKDVETWLKKYKSEDIYSLVNYDNEISKKLEQKAKLESDLKTKKDKLESNHTEKEKIFSDLVIRLKDIAKLKDYKQAEQVIIDLKEKLEKHNQLKIRYETNLENLEARQQDLSYEGIKAKLAELEPKLVKTKFFEIERQELAQQILQLTEDIDSLNQAQKSVDNKILALESMVKEKYRDKLNVSQVEVLLRQTKEQEQEQSKIHAALEKAETYLEQAFQKVQQTFSPLVNEKTSENFNIITNGKYDNVRVDKNFQITVEDKETNSLKEWGYLSDGTIDQAYLALRLAVAELLAAESENEILLPLLLDDVFAHYDEVRAVNTLEWIKTLSSKQVEHDKLIQVIFFTCHSSHRHWGEADSEINVITLS